MRDAFDDETYRVAELAGVGTEYLVYAEAGSARCHLRVVSGPGADYLGDFPTFRAAVLEAVRRIEREIRENACEEPELPDPPPALELEIPAFPVREEPA